MECTQSKDDTGLVEKCISKDASAWRALVNKYSVLIENAIYNRARKYGISLPCHDIEDIMQNVLTTIWKGNKLSTVKNRKNISCWLAVVSGNAAAQYLSDQDNIKPLGEEEEAIPVVPAPDEEAISEIEKAMEELPPKEKLIVQLYFFYDKKYREIADMLDLPEGTVSSYIKRSKFRLRKSLSRHATF